MLRGYRLLGIAALAAALLIAFGLGAYWTGLPHPQERYQPYQDSNAKEGGPLASISNVATRIVERTPCHNPESESESDLCAQWRAAKAAEKSAEWTLYGVIASAIGISFLLWQIMLTREAVKDTGDATIAMQQSNTIALDALRAQYRPSIQITVVGPYGRTTNRADPLAFPDGEKADAGIMQEARIHVYCNILNRSAHPITILEASISVLGGDGAPPQSTFYRLEPGQDVTYNNNTLPFGEELNERWPTDTIAVPDKVTLNKIFSDPPPVIGHIVHQDQLGVKRRLQFAYTPFPVIRSKKYRLWGGSKYNCENELPE